MRTDMLQIVWLSACVHDTLCNLCIRKGKGKGKKKRRGKKGLESGSGADGSGDGGPSAAAAGSAARSNGHASFASQPQPKQSTSAALAAPQPAALDRRAVADADAAQPGHVHQIGDDSAISDLARRLQDEWQVGVCVQLPTTKVPHECVAFELAVTISLCVNPCKPTAAFTSLHTITSRCSPPPPPQVPRAETVSVLTSLRDFRARLPNGGACSGSDAETTDSGSEYSDDDLSADSETDEDVEVSCCSPCWHEHSCAANCSACTSKKICACREIAMCMS